VQEWIADFNLVVGKCRQFNTVASLARQSAESLRVVFLRKLAVFGVDAHDTMMLRTTRLLREIEFAEGFALGTRPCVAAEELERRRGAAAPVVAPALPTREGPTARPLSDRRPPDVEREQSRTRDVEGEERRRRQRDEGKPQDVEHFRERSFTRDNAGSAFTRGSRQVETVKNEGGGAEDGT
jgi:hypothetical protein